MGLKNKRYIYFTCILILSFIIFGFSNANGEQSGGLSLKLTLFLVDLFQLDLSTSMIDVCHTLIRKCAHMSEFGLLYFFTYQFLKTYSMQRKKIVLYSFLFVLMQASLDEFHQLFIPNRSGNVIDVLVDMSGAFIMNLLLKFTKQ